MLFHHCCWLLHALQCPSPGRGPRLSRSYQSLALGSLIRDRGSRVVGGGQVKQKAHLRERFLSTPWDAMASAGLEFGLLTLEALIQPCVPPLKREAGKAEGV